MDDIINAIENQEVLIVKYNEAERRIEPHALGTNINTGKTLLRAFQIEGGSTSGQPEAWKMMNISKLEVISNTGVSFTPRPDYKRGDKGMTGGILAEV